MKYLLVCAILIVTKYAVAFKDQVEGECGQEFLRIYTTSQGCNGGHGYNVFKIDATLAKAASGDISKYQTRRYIANVCRSANNDTQCIRNIKSNEACENSSVVKLALNMNTVIATQVDYFCGLEPGTNRIRYLEMIKHDGPNCIAANSELKLCMENATNVLGLKQLDQVLKAEMCPILKTQVNCVKFYDQCKNKKVKEYMTEFLDILNEKYNCSPDV